MMNVPDTMGEPSCKRQENGDAITGPERPYKKARFAWQVKGKYHLKNEHAESSSSLKSSTSANQQEMESTPSDNENKDTAGNAEQNLEILGDYLLKQDFNSLDTVIGDSDTSLLTPSTSVSTEKPLYPRYISSHEYRRHSEELDSSMSIGQTENAAIAISMVESYSEDQCIARWQAKQIAKGFVDNTINRVLDSWMGAPLPVQMDNNRFLALDVADFINNLPENSIENEGILMAISAHGLQNTSSSSSSSDTDKPSSTYNSKEDSFPSPPTSPLASDEEMFTNNSQNSIQDHPKDVNMSWANDDEIKSKENSNPPPRNHPAFQYLTENNHLYPSLEYCDEHAHNTDDILSNHFEFMDAAVSFAIQNKGLTSFGTDYG